LPFIYGLEHSFAMKNSRLLIEHPANCARLLREGKAQIGLVPVGGLAQLQGFRMVSDYCIGAVGKVLTVALFSRVPLHEIRQIHLDSESLTSVRLVRYLADNYWKINPQWSSIDKDNQKDYADYDSVVLIGDKTFGLENQYPYVYDLAEQWKQHTGLPFVFAVWVAQEGVLQAQINQLNAALKWGVERIEASVEHYPPRIEKDLAIAYLNKNISFSFDEEKKKGLGLFMEYLSTV
ncbi:MAG: menaquinone biosynthesis protein, partial [Bacteroidota bacterium]